MFLRAFFTIIRTAIRIKIHNLFEKKKEKKSTARLIDGFRTKIFNL